MRSLGALEVSALGLGCMGLSFAYGTPMNETDGVRLLHEALDCGITFFDTAEVYGPYTNEQLLGSAFHDRRDRVVLATKFGFKNANVKEGLDSSPTNIRRMVDASLQRLRTDYIDLLYQHRVDPSTPIEVVAETVGDLIREGKVRAFGLSEASEATIRRAHTITPVSAVQSEFSLWWREAEQKVLPTLSELNIALVAYSPLGRGFLTGTIDSSTQFTPNDSRNHNPRFSADNIAQNMAVVEYIKTIAIQKGTTPAQIALAWCLAQGSNILPIPGTTKLHRLHENIEALTIKLTPDELTQLNRLTHVVPIAGHRINARMQSYIDQ